MKRRAGHRGAAPWCRARVRCARGAGGWSRPPAARRRRWRSGPRSGGRGGRFRRCPRPRPGAGLRAFRACARGCAPARLPSGMGGLEAGALGGGAVDFGGELAIAQGEFLDGAAGRVRERGDVGGEDVEVLAIADDAGGGDARIDRDDAHHLDGAAQHFDGTAGRANDFHETRQIGLFLRQRLGKFGGLGGDAGELKGGFAHILALQRGRQGLELAGEGIEHARAFHEAGADGDEGRFDALARDGNVARQLAERGGGGQRRAHEPVPSTLGALRANETISSAILPRAGSCRRRRAGWLPWACRRRRRCLRPGPRWGSPSGAFRAAPGRHRRPCR